MVMLKTRKYNPVLFFFLAGCILLLLSRTAHAVPSFARQTSMSCTACHTAWPQLTPFGRAFKMDGYTFSTESPSGRWHPPLAAMFQASYSSLAKNNGVLTNGIAPFDNAEDSPTDKTNLPQQAAIYYGGKIIDHLGAYIQITYSGTANDVHTDNTDVRCARTFAVGEHHLTVGTTVNNAPTVEDVWNTTPVFGFPFASSSVTPGPTAAPLIVTLAQEVGGAGVYASFANWVYGAVSVYRTTNDGITRPLGAGIVPGTVTDGAVPYWRAAVFHTWNKHSFELGTYGLTADVYPGGGDSGPINSFTDYAFDGQYQFISNPHSFTLRTTLTHEDQDWDASYNLGGTSNKSDTLKALNINASYFYSNEWGMLGGSAGYFSTTGDSDPLLYSPDPINGSRNGSPDSRGWILEADWIFKEKHKLAVQYTIYDKFNGARHNYDGFGRNASDNNTLYLLVRLMF
jgi:hypothetical protein